MVREWILKWHGEEPTEAVFQRTYEPEAYRTIDAIAATGAVNATATEIRQFYEAGLTPETHPIMSVSATEFEVPPKEGYKGAQSSRGGKPWAESVPRHRLC